MPAPSIADQVITTLLDLVPPQLGGATPHILIGLSGGSDSVCLFHMLANAHLQGTIKVTAAHFNHQWRDDAGKDLDFCKRLANQSNIPFVAGFAQDYQHQCKMTGSQEDLGRRMRRMFLEETLKTINAHAIALAHHAQDQEETFIIRLMRGSTLDGLTCMKPRDGLYVRPLLTIDKSAMLDYLAQNNHAFVTDPSNESDLYLRNRIRKSVMPALHSVDNRFGKKLATTIAALHAENLFLNKLANDAYKSVFTEGGLHKTGSCKKFKELPPVVQRRLVIDWLCLEKASFSPSAGFIKEALKFVLSDAGGSHQLAKSWKLIKSKGHFWIEKQPK